MNLARLLLLPLFLLPACSGSDETNASPQQPVADDGGASTTRPTAEVSTIPIGESLASVQGGSRSRVRFEFLDLDLGVVYQENTAEIRYPFEVDGSDPVTITGLDASCGCSEVSLEVEGESYPINTPIKAGAKGAVVGTFNAANYLNVKTATIRVLGNAMNLPLTLNLQTFVRRHFEISPGTARFGQQLARDLKENPVTQRIKVTAREPFEIKSWKMIPQGVEVDVDTDVQNLEDGRQVRYLTLKLTEAVPAGVFMRSVQAETSLGRDLEVHLYANVVGPVQYAPEEFLKFGAVTQGTLTKRQVKILASDPTITLPDPKIEFAGPEHFTWKLVEKEPGREWIVRFQLSETAPIGRHGGRLMISFPKDANLPSCEIKVSAMVRR
ncbi:MAG: DUF1573 domain-containing protein [Planctomycetes bacterium]|nr:DUF1573 domain-containing protein [Planctomycetota bacterium]